MEFVGIEEIRLFVKDDSASAKFYNIVFGVEISYQGLIPKFKIGNQQVLLRHEKYRPEYQRCHARFTITTSTSLREIEEHLKSINVKYFISDRVGGVVNDMTPAAIMFHDIDGYEIELRDFLYPKGFGKMKA